MKKPDTSRPTLNDDDSYMKSEVDRLAIKLMILAAVLTFVTLGMTILLIILLKAS